MKPNKLIGNPWPAKVFNDPLFGVRKRSSMASRFRSSTRKVAGVALILAGVLFWILVVVLPLSPLHIELPTSVGHVQKQFLGVTIGGASLACGIIFLFAPLRRRRRAITSGS